MPARPFVAKHDSLRVEVFSHLLQLAAAQQVDELFVFAEVVADMDVCWAALASGAGGTCAATALSGAAKEEAVLQDYCAPTQANEDAQLELGPVVCPVLTAKEGEDVGHEPELERLYKPIPVSKEDSAQDQIQRQVAKYEEDPVSEIRIKSHRIVNGVGLCGLTFELSGGRR